MSRTGSREDRIARNQLRFGLPVLLANQGPYNLWLGNDPRPSALVLEEWPALPDPATRSRMATERGLAAIAADPAGFEELEAPDVQTAHRAPRSDAPAELDRNEWLRHRY